MNFILNIKMGGAAMDSADDLARALREVADKLDGIELHAGYGGPILDLNGNSCGAYRVREGQS